MFLVINPKPLIDLSDITTWLESQSSRGCGDNFIIPWFKAIRNALTGMWSFIFRGAGGLMQQFHHAKKNV